MCHQQHQSQHKNLLRHPPQGQQLLQLMHHDQHSHLTRQHHAQVSIVTRGDITLPLETTSPHPRPPSVTTFPAYRVSGMDTGMSRNARMRHTAYQVVFKAPAHTMEGICVRCILIEHYDRKDKESSQHALLLLLTTICLNDYSVCSWHSLCYTAQEKL